MKKTHIWILLGIILISIVTATPVRLSTSDHSQLSNLNWSVSGHQIDTDIDMFGFNFTNWFGNQFLINQSQGTYDYNMTTIDTDTNVTTACSYSEVLLGNSTCMNITDFPFLRNDADDWTSGKITALQGFSTPADVECANVDATGQVQGTELRTLDGTIYFNAGGTVSLETNTLPYEGRFDFDGVNDFANTTDDWLDSNSTGSITAWINLSLSDTASYDTFVCYTTTDYESSNFCLRVDAINVGNNITKAWNGDSAGWNTIVSNGTVTADGQWHFIVLNPAEIWIDGVNFSYTFTQGSGGAIDDWFSDTYRIGNYDHHFVLGSMERQSPVYYFNGSVDDVGIWDNPLTSAEISALNSSGRNNGVPTQDGLLAYWNGYDGTWIDKTDNNHNMSNWSGATAIAEETEEVLESNVDLYAPAFLTTSTFVLDNESDPDYFKNIISGVDYIRGTENNTFAKIDHETIPIVRKLIAGKSYLDLEIMIQVVWQSVKKIFEKLDEQQAKIDALEERIKVLEGVK